MLQITPQQYCHDICKSFLQCLENELNYCQLEFPTTMNCDGKKSEVKLVPGWNGGENIYTQPKDDAYAACFISYCCG